MMRTLNRFFFELCKISVEKFCISQNRPLNRRECAQMILNHLAFSKEHTYEDILEIDIYSTQISNMIDLTRVIKHHYIQLVSQTITHEQRQNL